MNRRLEKIWRLTVVVAVLTLMSCNAKQDAAPASGPKAAPAAEAEPPPQTKAEPAAPPPKKTLLMHYMPWYTTPAVSGEWSGHWRGWASQHRPDRTDTNGLPDIWSHYHPLIGVYDSSDPDVIECHLLQMKLAGVEGVIPAWNGIGDVVDYPAGHKASRMLFDACAKFGMKFAVCYEDRSVDLMVKWNRIKKDQIADHLVATMQWMQKEWFSKPQYFKLYGRPLLLNFGPIYVKDQAPWDAAFASLPERPTFFALHHLWKSIGGDGGFTWVHYDPWEDDPSDERIRVRINEVFTYFSKNPKEVIVSAYPGFKDVYDPPMPWLDHRDGKTMQETLEVAMAGPWPLIQLVTWNDYGEGTMIEPTHEFGYKFLEIVQQAKRKELGKDFNFTAEDLRLPARLYALRKKGGVPAADLDRISQLLNEGACSEARKLLDTLEKT